MIRTQRLLIALRAGPAATRAANRALEVTGRHAEARGAPVIIHRASSSVVRGRCERPSVWRESRVGRAVVQSNSVDRPLSLRDRRAPADGRESWAPDSDSGARRARIRSPAGV